MNGLPVEFPLMAMWIAFTVTAVLGIAALLVWAVRARQFSGQDRARYLALEAKVPDAPADEAQKPSDAKKPGVRP
jgi:hypothetical protein